MLAKLADAPLFAFFAFRAGPGRYHFTMSEIPLRAESARPDRKNRDAALQAAAQAYAGLLERALREHPYEWFHFDRFVEDQGA